MEKLSLDQQLRQKIEKTNAQIFSTESIESRIAKALLADNEFLGDLTASELEVILRNVVYVMFARQKVAGMDVGLVHNVPTMDVKIQNGEADIEFIVHIHKPVIVFLEFTYTLVNSLDGAPDLCVREDSLQINERTRRFDLKAKAALTALNVQRIAEQELSNPAGVIAKTLPDQIRQQGVDGEFSEIGLRLHGDALRVFLSGEFEPYAAAEPVLHSTDGQEA